MLLLDYQNVLIESLLKDRFAPDAAPTAIDQIVSDFDNVTFHISTPESKTRILISTSIKCYRELVQYGAEEVLQREYGPYIVAPEQGYDFSIQVDLENLPESQEEKDDLVRRISLLKRNAMAAPFEQAFDEYAALHEEASKYTSESAPQGVREGGGVRAIHYRDEEAIYIKASHDRVTAAPSSTAKETPSATVSLTPEQSSSAACLEACGPSGDVACTSKCIAVPNPNDSQVNQTTDCVAKCPQGDGSEAETNEFARCTQECISKYYFSSGGTPNPTTTADSKGPSGTSGSSSPKVTQVVETVTDKDGKTTESTKTSTMDSAATGSSEASETSGSAPPDSAGAMFAPVGLLAFFGAVLAL